jgi:ferric-dicitrate binding protein FerR (iron transport regulator)
MVRLLFLLVFFCSLPALAGDLHGEVKFLRGTATAAGRKLALGSQVQPGEEVVTGKGSVVRLRFSDGSAAMTIGPESRIKFAAAKLTTVDLLGGTLLSAVKALATPAKEIRYQVRVKGAALGVRGTTFFAKLGRDGRVFQCICEGTVETSWGDKKESFTSKHHDLHRYLNPDGSSEPAPMGEEHDDMEAAELAKLLNKS